MLLSFLKATRLCAWLSCPEYPQAIQECKVLLDHAYDNHNVIIDRLVSDCQPVTVPTDLEKLIKRRVAILHSCIKDTGVMYSHSSTHLGNSLILFYSNGNHSSPPVPGCIKYIYEIDNTISFAVQQQCALPVGSFDPFILYPYFPARTYTSALLEQCRRDGLWPIMHDGQFQMITLWYFHCQGCVHSLKL